MTEPESTTVYQHRDRHGRRLYANAVGDQLVLVLTTPQAPGVTRVEFTPAEWQALVAVVLGLATPAAVSVQDGEAGR